MQEYFFLYADDRQATRNTTGILTKCVT